MKGSEGYRWIALGRQSLWYMWRMLQLFSHGLGGAMSIMRCAAGKQKTLRLSVRSVATANGWCLEIELCPYIAGSTARSRSCSSYAGGRREMKVGDAGALWLGKSGISGLCNVTAPSGAKGDDWYACIPHVYRVRHAFRGAVAAFATWMWRWVDSSTGRRRGGS